MGDRFVMAMLAPYGLVMSLAAPLVLYVIARWRAQRDEVVDPQLGIKVALCLFVFLAFETLLAGATVLVYAVFSKADDKGDLYRAAFALLLPAIIVLAAHVMMLRKTNQERFPGVRQLFLGFTLVVTGLAGFTGLVLAFQALFMKGSSGELGPFSGAMVVVFGSAWAIVGWQFGRLVLPPDEAAPPAAPPVAAPPPPQTPGLPSLGGGAFPPIEKR